MQQQAEYIRITDSVTEAIKKYLTGKKYQSAKYQFFDAILKKIDDNSLTVSFLMRHLYNNRLKFSEFFNAKIGSNKAQGLLARLIENLYGIDYFTVADLTELIKNIQNLDRQKTSIDEFCQIRLSNIYNNWNKCRDDNKIHKKKILDHEIKYYIIDNFPSFFTDSNHREQSIYELMKKFGNDHLPDKLSEILTRINTRLPDYLPEFIHEIITNFKSIEDNVSIIAILEKITKNTSTDADLTKKIQKIIAVYDISHNVGSAVFSTIIRQDTQRSRSPSSTKSDSQSRESITESVSVSTSPQPEQVASFIKTAESIYQQYIVNKAIREIENTMFERLRFDPQGKLLVAVTLDENDYQQILDQLPATSSNNNAHSAREQVMALLGSTDSKKAGTATTHQIFCNIDCTGIPELERLFVIWLSDIKDKNETFSKALDIYNDQDNPERNSVIPLQLEIEMHSRLLVRALEKSITDTNYQRKPDYWEFVRSSFSTTLNRFVLSEFRVALISSFDTINDKIDYINLNRLLDQARRKISERCPTLLIEALQQPPINIEKATAIKLISQANLSQQLLTSTTATGMDYLATSAHGKSSIRISATENTAHNKQLGADTQALRTIHRCVYTTADGQPTVMASSTPRAEARVPSIAEKSTDKSESAYIDDVKQKIAANMQVLTRQYQHSATQIEGQAAPSLVYNLLTSLYTEFNESVLTRSSKFEGNNQQTLSAKRIMLGVHQFNREQFSTALNVSSSAAHNVQLCLLQNIPVNQHTDPLSLASTTPIIADAAFMAELSLASTLAFHADKLNPELSRCINELANQLQTTYKSFVTSRMTQPYLCQTNFLEDAKNILTRSRASNGVAFKAKSNDIVSLTAAALAKITFQQQHFIPQYGMLVQSLSVFLQPMTLYGCKSANERLHGVAGRVECLTAIANKAVDENLLEEKTLLTTLEQFINGRCPIEQLQKALDIAYNAYYLYGATASISMEDQGAGSKVQASSNRNNGRLSTIEFNTNIAESGHLTKLSQTHTSSMQSHKTSSFEVLTRLAKSATDATMTRDHTSQL